MKLVVIGATGTTGQHVVREALEQGHEVTAVVRNPDRITTTHEQLKVLKGDLKDPTQLVELFRGGEAVLSAIGEVDLWPFKVCDVYTSTGKAVISAMREAGINRFICVTSWGTKDDPNLPFILRWVLKPTLLRKGIKNMGELEEFLENDCADINYTAVRPPRLVDSKCSSKPLQVTVDGQCVIESETNAISRHDVAKFMLSCLATDEYDKKMVAITARKEDC